MADTNFPVPPPGTPNDNIPPYRADNITPDVVPPARALSPAANPPAPATGPGFWKSLWKTTPAPSANHPPVDSTREVVETVVFVIVLVLLLKSFVAEAFVIPTGSMAETLWGYQKVIKCPACDTIFPVNCSSEVDPADGRIEKVMGCVCPNCFKRITLIDPTLAGNIPLSDGQVFDPGYTSGDRVLVAKFLYDLFASLPHRLDVVVFKYPGNSGSGPGEAAFPRSGPFKGHVPMNYIKRLIGISGETIAVCNGKLYILTADKSPKYDDLKEELKNAKTPEEREQWLAQLWQQRYMHIDDAEAKELFRKGQFQILRKSPENLLAMMRLVYDNDNPARDLKDPESRRWQSANENTWLEDKANGFRCKSAAESLSWLRYHHRTRDHIEDRRISPFMGYNTDRNNREELEEWVGDLTLECEVTVDQAQGEFVLELSKGPDRFQAQWNLADGFCTLYRVTNADPEAKLEGKGTRTVRKELDSKKTALTGGTHRLRFANVDQQLVVWVDGKLVFQDGFRYDVPEPPLPTDNDLQPASIGAMGTSVQVKHVKLFHDTYYNIPGYTPNYKEPPRVMTMYVQPDHFLCMGDNSFHSSDSRSWGVVPRRLMLGKALAVYYPFYFPWWPLSSQVNRIGLIH
jgi:signal peptidase I